MRVFKRRREVSELEVEPGLYRLRPRAEFAHALAKRVREDGRRSPAHSFRVAVAVGFLTVMLAAPAAFGGWNYAAGESHRFVKTIGALVAKPAARTTKKPHPRKRVTPATDQYEGQKCLVLHRTGSSDKIMEVSGGALRAHLAHGDVLISCRPA